MTAIDSAAPPAGETLDVSPARRPQRITLEGRLIRLEPLDPDIHGDALYRSTHGPGKDDLWRYLWEGPFSDPAGFEAHLRQKTNAADSLLFALVDKASGEAVGCAAYMRIEPAHRSIEVGRILYTPLLQRTAAATEAMYLMAKHVFDDLGYRRYEWKCDARNLRSRKAALRLGFSFEGIFRQHMIIKSQNRDTAWFSMLDSEWSVCKRAFERWLDPANFDNQGKQKFSLSSLRFDSRDGNSWVPIKRETAEHYEWGKDCDGWHLVNNGQLSVIEEQMPPGTAEARHCHLGAQQFFYVLSGEGVMEIEGKSFKLSAREGVHILPGVSHVMRNQSNETLKFLVISQPPSHGDRVVLPRSQ